MKKILLVDDVATNLICASEVLRSDYDVSTAKSGRQALLMLEEMTPDLIILDINMPVMDGYEVFQKIKDNPSWVSIPVVFLTAEADVTKEIKGLEMGAMDFIKKPFEPEVMKTRIDKILQITEHNKALEGAAKRDPLTGLTTRNALKDYINNQPECKVGHFLLMDLDNFKAVNDNFGHIVGDSVLVAVANVLKEVFGVNDGVSRLGGDEFAIFVPGEKSRDEVRALLRRVIAMTEFEISEILADLTDFKVSVSIGVACKPSDAEDYMELYADSDKALYLVKQHGKRGFHFYDTMLKDREDFDEESSRINILQLQRLISETEYKDGAYTVEYEGFKRIYRFVARCMDRKSRDVQIVLFTLHDNNNNPLSEDNEYINILAESVRASLRRGDVATRSGNEQYIVILMDANEDNGFKVAERIRNGFEKTVNDKNITLSFEMESVAGSSAK